MQSVSLTVQKIIPLVCMIVVFVLLLWFGSGQSLQTLSPQASVAFWIAEVILLVAFLIWLQNRIEWARDDLKRFVSTTLFLSGLASAILAVPSIILDMAFGIISVTSLSERSMLQAARMIAFEYVEEVIMLFGPCAVFLTLVNWLKSVGIFSLDIFPSPNVSDEAAFSQPHAETPVFWEKVERRRHGRLLAIEAKQHYMLVHTTVGTELIHYRFGKAVEELRSWEGARVHRSYWVARAAIEEIVVKGRECSVVLTSGAEIPVSRGRKAAALAEFKP